MGRLDGQRVLVVGASKGLGRAFVEHLVDEGAEVAAAARTAIEPTPHMHALTCDVREPESCNRVVTEAIELLGGLDALVYAPGITAITKLEHASPEHWRSVLETNVLGAGLVTAAAMAHLEATSGTVVFLSSVSAHVNPPWVGMGLYALSKAALEKSAQVWKLEHPTVRVTTMVIGATGGTSFFPSAEKPPPDELERLWEDWHARGYVAEEPLEPADQAHALVDILTSRAQMDVVWVRPRTQFQRWVSPSS